MNHSALFTDLYQLTMAKAYLDAGKSEAPAIFELFFRRPPFKGEYAIVAGYDLVRDILENFHFSADDIAYLKDLPVFQKTSDSFFDYLKGLDLKDVDVWGIPEGQLAFPRVPILQVRGPLLKAQLLESALLNAVNFATLVATYARRMRMVCEKKQLIEFGLRRAQGPNGAKTATRASYVGGFDASSNIVATKELGIPAAGTMAHSFVQSFRAIEEVYHADLKLQWPAGILRDLLEKYAQEDEAQTNEGELAAFMAYANAFPDDCVLLVDTYDTVASGLINAIRVFKILRAFGHKPKGIRLDSGDLVYLSKMARQKLDAEGFQEAKILASNELDEEVIVSLQDQGALIDTYAVGTRLVTAAEEPALGGVYKLVDLEGHPRMKISQQTEKLVIPGAKQVYRLYGADGIMLLDLLALQSETAPRAGEEIRALHPSDPFKQARVIPSRVEPLLQPLFHHQKWLDHSDIHERQRRSLKWMESLRCDVSRRANPTPYKVSLTPTLKALLETVYNAERPKLKLK